jgi:hypothetical protein
MDQTTQPPQLAPEPLPQNPAAAINSEQLELLKQQVIDSCQVFASSGSKTHKDASSADGSDETYDYFDNEATFESAQWSVHFWKYANEHWAIQITKIESRNDGHSLMVSYSIKPTGDPIFPGFQVYEEGIDKSYHPMAAENIVYLQRVSAGLKATIPPTPSTV